MRFRSHQYVTNVTTDPPPHQRQRGEGNLVDVVPPAFRRDGRDRRARRGEDDCEHRQEPVETRAAEFASEDEEDAPKTHADADPHSAGGGGGGAGGGGGGG